jgi:hypothetical protein
LGLGLAEVAERLEPAVAARLCAEAAKLLNEALAQNPAFVTRAALAQGLVAVADRLEPAKAAGVCAEAARLLSRALAEEKKDWSRRESLVTGLMAVAKRLDLAEADHLFTDSARSSIRALNQGASPSDWRACAAQVSLLLQPLDSEWATNAARGFAARIVSDPDLVDLQGGPGMLGGMPGPPPPSGFSAVALERFLTSAPRLQVRTRAVAIAAAVGLSATSPTLSRQLLSAPAEPLSCRLATQDLVELLKMPTCVREVRRVILDQLGNRYGRRFETHWDFVRYAQEQGLNLDFTTPSQRPDRKWPPLFQE